jgi:3-deoxy-D-arabino-heptulosonate 7-phosphate (DAHP) synthase
MSEWYSSPRTQPYKVKGLTPLNLEVQARYEACNGNHVRSGVVIQREWEAVEHTYWVCANCDVPQKMGRRLVGFSRSKERAA